MPDQTVQVTFTPPNTWQFTPRTARLTAAGKVKLQQHPANAAWKFVTANVGGGGDQFQVTVHPNGTHVTVDDRYTTPGTFPYTVTVTQGGQQYTSGAEGSVQRLAADPPPTIENAPSLKQGDPDGAV